MGYAPVKQETQEQYLKIWAEYVMARESQEKLATVFGCSMDTIYNALAWVAGHRLQFESSVLMEIAKATTESKLRRLEDDISRIKGSEPVGWNSIIGLEKLVFSYAELLWKLNGVIYDRNVIQVSASVPSPEIKWIHNLTEEMNSLGLTEEERKVLSDSLGKIAECQTTMKAIIQEAQQRRDKGQVETKILTVV